MVKKRGLLHYLNKLRENKVDKKHSFSDSFDVSHSVIKFLRL